jgi:hypothetical protein
MFSRMLYARQEFEDYAQKFTAVGDTRVSQRSTGRQRVSPDFVVDDAMIGDFRAHLEADRIKIDEEAFAKDLPFIKAMIRFRIDEVVFGISAARQRLIAVDPQAQLALTMFGEAQKLAALSRAASKAQ